MKKLMLVVLVVVLVLSGCAKGDYDYETSSTTSKSEDKKMDVRFSDSKEEAAEEMEIAPGGLALTTSFTADDGSGSTSKDKLVSDGAMSALSTRKIIKTGNVYIESLHFDDASESIFTLMHMYDGYASATKMEGGSRNQEHRQRFATYTVKIPAEHYDNFMYDLKSVGHVLNATNNTSDVTSTIVDIEARLKTLKIQEARMLDILDKLESLEDIVELEYALQEVRYEIESYSSNLRNLEERVKFSTVTIRLQEVLEETIIIETPITFSDRLSNGLDRTFEDIKNGFLDFVLYVAINFPYIIFWGIVLIITTLIIRRKIKNNKGLNQRTGENPSDVRLDENKEDTNSQD